MAVDHERAQPRKAAAGRHRKTAPTTVAGQFRVLTAVRSAGGGSSRHRAGRRAVPKAGGPLGLALATLEEVEELSWVPVRVGSAAAVQATLPDTQFDIGGFVTPAQTVDGLEVYFPPVYTVFVTARLLRCPTVEDQRMLGAALDAIEATYAFRPEGVFSHVAYGVPYFRRLPGGLSGPVLFRHMPRQRGDANRFVLEDVAGAEDNDLLLTFRGDKPANIRDVINWLRGSNSLAARRIASPRLSQLLTFTSSRAMFVQVGLPRKIANAHQLEYASSVDFRSPTWTEPDHGLLDGPAAAVTFCGAESAPLTTADPGDYLDYGAIQQLTHAILDLPRLYAPGPLAIEAAPGDQSDQAGQTRTLAPVEDVPAGYAAPAEAGPAPVRLGLEGPGFDTLDVADGEKAPKLHTGGFFPTAALAAQDAESRLLRLAGHGAVTRSQNFLVPPRRHRAFPLLELT